MLTKAKYRLLASVIFLFISLITYNIYAQAVSFKTLAPSSVTKGQTFSIAYSLENAASESDIQGITSISGFDILYGPASSTSHSTTIINGQVSSSSSETYTYTLAANSEGTFTIPSATIRANGKTYKSNSVQIKVLPPDKNAQNAQTSSRTNSGAGQNQTQEVASAGSQIKPNDIFIKTNVSKAKLFEQEAAVVTFRVYSKQRPISIQILELPDFNGFMVEDYNFTNSQQLAMEHYNGQNYYTYNLYRTLLFPQHSGNIEISKGKAEIVVSAPSGKMVMTVMGPMQMDSEVKKTLTTTPLNIDVLPLPSGKPSSFANAIGTFSITPSISATDIKANDAVTLKLVISGTGNMKLIKIPELNLPKDFETYDPKITNDLKVTENGLTGTKTIEYLFIPRYEGSYKIDPIEFSYFDPKSNSYKTISTPEYTLDVAKDPNAANSNNSTSFTQTEVKAEQDIRYIKTGKTNLIEINDFLFGSLIYYLCYIIPSLFFIIFFALNRKKIKAQTDLIRTRNKRANKVAIKRLKQALIYLRENKKESFYEEVLRATWGYLSDKLSIPVADLNRENIESEMSKYGATRELINKFIYSLDTCEFAHYAPVESNTAMDELYHATITAIAEMENSKSKNNKPEPNESENKSSKYR